MLDYNFFLGLNLPSSLISQLKNLDPAMQSVFLNSNDSHYLQLINYEDNQYIGKYFSSPLDVSNLENLQINISSLIKCLFPTYIYSSEEFYILTLPIEHE